MKTTFVVTMLLSMAAWGRTYYTTNYTCAQLKALVKAHKLVMLSDGFWSGRWASKGHYCEPRDTTVKSAWITAVDGSCSPGIYCMAGFKK